MSDAIEDRARELLRGPLVGASDGGTYEVRVPTEAALVAALRAEGNRRLGEVLAMIAHKRTSSKFEVSLALMDLSDAILALRT